ncbi:LLM class F420-dependent oxidoreductase [Nocardioides endophyticus]|uniref:LLM class F420-dependent oxidoreductase n=1 Tax=Nocardioides endophyticus TaxID=1353775 RepID=A0ABP8YXE5_9ACTN
MRDTDRVLLDIQLDARPDLAVARARELAATGIAGLFTFEGPHDVFLPLAAAAAAGVETDLMTNVAIAMPRSPMHLANTAYDLQLMSSGRFRLGLGSQIKPHIEKRYGATWSPPAARMREIVLAVKAILGSWQDGTPLHFEGEHTRHTLMPPTFVPGPSPYGVPPVLLGALGPVMTRTAADVADGLLVMPFHSHQHFRTRTLPAVDEGLSRSGRRREDFSILPQAIVAMGRTSAEMEAAVAGVRGLLAFYGSTPAYVPVLEAEGWEGVQPELNRLSKTGDFGAMFELVTDEMLATLAVRGTPEECAAEIGRRFGDVAERVCCYFPGYEPPMGQIADLAGALRGM